MTLYTKAMTSEFNQLKQRKLAALDNSEKKRTYVIKHKKHMKYIYIYAFSLVALLNFFIYFCIARGSTLGVVTAIISSISLFIYFNLYANDIIEHESMIDKYLDSYQKIDDARAELMNMNPSDESINDFFSAEHGVIPPPKAYTMDVEMIGKRIEHQKPRVTCVFLLICSFLFSAVAYLCVFKPLIYYLCTVFDISNLTRPISIIYAIITLIFFVVTAIAIVDTEIYTTTALLLSLVSTNIPPVISAIVLAVIALLVYGLIAAIIALVKVILGFLAVLTALTFVIGIIAFIVSEF